MAHYYSDRTSFYGIEVDRFLPFNFLRDVHIQAPIVWIGLSWIGAALFLAPAISGGGAEGPGLSRRCAVLGHAAHRRRRADRQLSRHHGLHRRGLVLVRQSGPLLHPARPRLADRLLRRAGDLEPAGVPRAVADPRDAAAGDPTVLVRPHPAGAPDLGLHRQHRGALRVRHDPAHRDREVLHDHRFLALVGGPSLGRAVLRVLRRGDERLSADGGRAGLAPARRAGGLFRADPDLPRRRARHRPPPLLGRRPEHVGAAGHACSPSSRCCRWCC